MMRIIKLGIISLVVFSLMITLISLFFPSKVRISKATDINTDRATVMDQLKDTASWRDWYPDSEGTAALPVITDVTDSSVTATSLPENGRKGITGWNIYQSSAPATVTLQWYMDIKLRWYPWEKFSGLLLEKRYGPVMEKGLDNLKNYLQKR